MVEKTSTQQSVTQRETPPTLDQSIYEKNLRIVNWARSKSVRRRSQHHTRVCTSDVKSSHPRTALFGFFFHCSCRSGSCSAMRCLRLPSTEEEVPGQGRTQGEVGSEPAPSPRPSPLLPYIAGQCKASLRHLADEQTKQISLGIRRASLASVGSASDCSFPNCGYRKLQ